MAIRSESSTEGMIKLVLVVTVHPKIVQEAVLRKTAENLVVRGSHKVGFSPSSFELDEDELIEDVNHQAEIDIPLQIRNNISPSII